MRMRGIRWLKLLRKNTGWCCEDRPYIILRPYIYYAPSGLVDGALLLYFAPSGLGFVKGEVVIAFFMVLWGVSIFNTHCLSTT
jgi:hypothetical protein